MIGCGFNVSNAKPTVCLDEVIAKHAGGSLPAIPMESVLAGALTQFSRDYTVLARHGSFKPFLERYYRRWIHSGQTVEVIGDDKRQRSVIIAGITTDGYLHGKTIDGGARVELEPDGNTFDMMRGLIQRKL